MTAARRVLLASAAFITLWQFTVVLSPFRPAGATYMCRGPAIEALNGPPPSLAPGLDDWAAARPPRPKCNAFASATLRRSAVILVAVGLGLGAGLVLSRGPQPKVEQTP